MHATGVTRSPRHNRRMALPFSNTADRARGLKSRIDACLEGKGGETARRGRAAELGQAYLSLSPAGRKKFLLTLARDYGLSREAAAAEVERWRASKEPAHTLRRALEPPAVRLL